MRPGGGSLIVITMSPAIAHPQSHPHHPHHPHPTGSLAYNQRYKIQQGWLGWENTLTKPCCCKIQEFKMSPSGYKMHIRSDIEMLNCHFVNHTLQRENDRVFAESGTISHKSAPIPSQSQSSLNIVILSVWFIIAITTVIISCWPLGFAPPRTHRHTAGFVFDKVEM